MSVSRLSLRPATPEDVPHILAFIRELAEYEKLTHEVSATEELLQRTLFGPKPFAETLIGSVDDVPAGFAVYFYSYSTFLALPGIYLEDLYVQPKFRKLGLGKALITEVARIAVERGCGRYEWSVLDWNTPSIRFYESLGAEMHRDWRRMRISGPALEEMAKICVR
ncbi:MAG TPA: GNAT family N-acetyltransferase [Verrucomicrobiales bacterium]|jgi:GNAT superfamily N-acetyltransferase|nr:GNAT family N-acetyltransferase [Verrucomicrobiales bacterium]